MEEKGKCDLRDRWEDVLVESLRGWTGMVTVTLSGPVLRGSIISHGTSDFPIETES